MAINIKNVLVILNEKFGRLEESQISDEEMHIAQSIIEILEGSSNYFEVEERLEFDDCKYQIELIWLDSNVKNRKNFYSIAFYIVFRTHECTISDNSSDKSDDEDSFDDDDSDSDWKDEGPPVAKSAKSEITLDQKKAAVEFWVSSKPRRSLSTVNAKYRFVTSVTQLYRFKLQIEKGNNRKESVEKEFLRKLNMRHLFFEGGALADKYKQINDYVLEKFNSARCQFGTIHEMDLRRWAMEKSDQVCTCLLASRNKIHSRHCSNVVF